MVNALTGGQDLVAGLLGIEQQGSTIRGKA